MKPITTDAGLRWLAEHGNTFKPTDDVIWVFNADGIVVDVKEGIYANGWTSPRLSEHYAPYLSLTACFLTDRGTYLPLIHYDLTRHWSSRGEIKLTFDKLDAVITLLAG
jgi:hypothetical protein